MGKSASDGEASKPLSKHEQRKMDKKLRRRLKELINDKRFMKRIDKEVIKSRDVKEYLKNAYGKSKKEVEKERGLNRSI
jgi:hypothetical protein